MRPFLCHKAMSLPKRIDFKEEQPVLDHLQCPKATILTSIPHCTVKNMNYGGLQVAKQYVCDIDFDNDQTVIIMMTHITGYQDKIQDDWDQM